MAAAGALCCVLSLLPMLLLWTSFSARPSLDAEARLRAAQAAPGAPVMRHAEALAAMYPPTLQRVPGWHHHNHTTCADRFTLLLAADMDVASRDPEHGGGSSAAARCGGATSAPPEWIDEVPLTSASTPVRGMEPPSSCGAWAACSSTPGPTALAPPLIAQHHLHHRLHRHRATAAPRYDGALLRARRTGVYEIRGGRPIRAHPRRRRPAAGHSRVGRRPPAGCTSAVWAGGAGGARTTGRSGDDSRRRRPQRLQLDHRRERAHAAGCAARLPLTRRRVARRDGTVAVHASPRVGGRRRRPMSARHESDAVGRGARAKPPAAAARAPPARRRRRLGARAGRRPSA